MKIYTWNVNGIRAVQKKGFVDWVLDEKPDILCLQETKAHLEQLEKSLTDIDGYYSYWHSAKRKGYSGVATYSRQEPLVIESKLSLDEFDDEGRVLVTHYPGFSLLNIYFPNGQMGEERVDYKLRFYETIIEYCNQLKNQGKRLIICGDFNTAHQEIDLANPKSNENVSGFLPVERAMLDTFLGEGYIDVYRYLHPDTVSYTWWSYRTRARERNVGWRIDYFYASANMIDFVADCYPLTEVQGSDHCPLALILKDEINN